MISDRKIFSDARFVCDSLGTSVEVQYRDEFSSKEIFAELAKDEMSILWSKCILFDTEGTCHDAEKIEIYIKDFQESAFDTEEELAYMGVLKDDESVIDTFIYFPGEWIHRLKDLSENVSLKE